MGKFSCDGEVQIDTCSSDGLRDLIDYSLLAVPHSHMVLRDEKNNTSNAWKWIDDNWTAS